MQQKPWKIQHVLQQVLQGIAFLHQNHIIHRDIKYEASIRLSSLLSWVLLTNSSSRLENILMRSETQPIITDFDISKDSTQTHKTSLRSQAVTAWRWRGRRWRSKRIAGRRLWLSRHAPHRRAAPRWLSTARS